MTGLDTIREVRAKSDTCLLAFSCGKDSIAAWLELRRHFKTIIPFYMYLIPELEFVEENLRYYEDFFGARIHRIAHPSLYAMLRNLVFQPPTAWPVIQAARLPAFDYHRIERLLAAELGLGDEVYTATGVRASDSITRRVAIKKHGAVNHAKQKFYPVWDWGKQKLIDEIDGAGCKLPSDYRMFGRSFDGLGAEYLVPMKQHYPRDYARVLEFFPLAELEINRRQYAGM